MDRKFVRIYNLKIDKLIEEEKLYSELIITYDLHYYLDGFEGVYKSILEDNFFSRILKKTRCMFFAIERNWIEKQDVYVKESTTEIGPKGYTCQTSTITICIQLYKEELSELRNELILKEDIIKEVMQKTLEYIVFRYNEVMDGKRFFTPTYLDASMICYMICKNYLDKKEILWQKVTPNDTIVNDGNNSDIKTIIPTKINTWKYFYNKCKHHFYSFEYLDVIISGAICLESYIYNILRANLNTEEKIKSFSMEQDEQGNEHPLSIRKLLRKIRDTKWIKYTLSDSKMDRIVGRILNPRNNIMHGKYEFSFNLKENATQSYMALKEFFNIVSIPKKEENTQPLDNYISRIDTNNTIIYRKKIQEAIKEKDFDKQIILFKKAIDYYPESELGYRIMAMNFAKQYKKTNMEDYKNLFEENINESVNKSKNKNQSLLFKAYGYYIMKEHIMSLNTLDEIDKTEKDERCICLTIQNFLEFYNSLPDKLSAKRIYCLCSNHNNTNDLLNIVAGDMFFKLKEYDKALFFYRKTYSRNSLSQFLLLRILKCYKESKDINNLIKTIYEIIEKDFYIFDETYQVDFEEFTIKRLDFYKEIKDIIDNVFCYFPLNNDIINSMKKKNKAFLIPNSIEYLEKKYNKKIKTNRANEFFTNYNMNPEIRIGESGLSSCMVEMKMGQLLAINNIKDELFYRGNLFS